MKRFLLVAIPLVAILCWHPAERPALAAEPDERPAPGDSMTFSEKVKAGFPMRWGKLEVHAPWGARYKYEGPNELAAEFDLSRYRTPLQSKIVSRRWKGNAGMYLANEEFLSGFSFWMDLVRGGFPVAHSPALQWVTVLESYWYSRYMLNYVQGRAHMGIHMIHGPYWTLKALDLHEKDRYIRDRGERIPGNKGIMLGFYVPIYCKRTGWPRVFENANPTMLDYKSGDPHFVGPVPTSDTFADPQSDKVYGWGIPAYLVDWRNTQWDGDTIDRTIDLGIVGQTMKKKLVWTRAFFRSTHQGPSPGDPTATVELLGESGESGFLGLALTIGSLNGLLEIKASLIADESGSLGGINPFTYDPAKGLRYVPHEIRPNLIMVGDMPERPNAYHVSDRSSRLWDQASLLWAATDYYDQAFRFQKTLGVDVGVFSLDPPADGGLIEQRTYRVALGLSNLIVRNLAAMHRSPSGVLASKWTPEKKTGDTVSVRDSAMVIEALNDYDQRLAAHAPEAYAELRAKAREMARAQADFLVRVQASDGSFHERYRISDGTGIGKNTRMRAQFFAIRALCAAWNLTSEDLYLQRARRTWNLLNSKYWDEATGLYRSELGRDVVIYTPWDLAAAYGAIRELVLASPAHRARPLLRRFVRFWIQSLDNSGMQMSEDHMTGEASWGIVNADADGDGIPFLAQSHGKYGVAPVPAAKIAINLGGSDNSEFAAIDGEPYVPASLVRATYLPRTHSEEEVILPEVEVTDATYVQRTAIPRWMGWTGRLAPSKKIHIGSNLTGEQIYRQNCAVCHGQRGEGILGFDLKDDMFKFTKDAVVETITKGRFEKGMPSWGESVDDLNVVEGEEKIHLGNVLSEEEIDRVADYIKGDLGKKYKETETYEAYRAHGSAIEVAQVDPKRQRGDEQ